MDNLSKREKLLFDFLKRRKAPVSIDDVVDHLCSEEDKEVTRNAVSVSMKYLAAKIAQEGYLIKNETGRLGAGNKSSFLLVKQ